MLPDDFAGANGLYVMTANLKLIAPDVGLVVGTTHPKDQTYFENYWDDDTNPNGSALPRFHGISKGIPTAISQIPAGTIKKAQFSASTAETIVRLGVERFAALPEEIRRPAELLPFATPPRGDPPPDYLVWSVSIRGLDRDSKGELRRRDDLTKRNGGPQGDFLWLTGAEWRSLVPPDGAVEGSTYSVPEPIASRIISIYLTGVPSGYLRIGWRDVDFVSSGIMLTVEKDVDREVRLRLDGSARLALDGRDDAPRHAVYRLLGHATYDKASETFERFDFVAVGDEYDIRDPETVDDLQKQYFDPSGRNTLGIAFELAKPGSLGYGTPPLALRLGRPWELRRYFGVKELDRDLRSYFRWD